MNRFQHNIELLNLSLLFNGFEFMLLKNTLVLCLNDEYTPTNRRLRKIQPLLERTQNPLRNNKRIIHRRHNTTIKPRNNSTLHNRTIRKHHTTTNRILEKYTENGGTLVIMDETGIINNALSNFNINIRINAYVECRFERNEL